MAADGSTLIDEASATVIGFAGGGGSSFAFKKATGKDPDLAMNHWDVAVYTHQRLFPATEHHIADIYDVEPASWRPGAKIRFAWFSPDCTDHSKAKGGAPKSERIRGLAWCVIPWAKLRQVQTIMLENVEEWFDWGPVYRSPDDWRANGVRGRAGDPIKALRGVTRGLWVRRLHQCGYWVEFRVLRTADYGKATTRKRLYGIAEHVGVERVSRIALGLEPSPIRWPEPTHAPRSKAAKLALQPWVGFDTCADWSEPCPSIFLTPAEVEELRRTTGRKVKRPLVAATLKRIARGLDRYVISSPRPFIVPITHAGDSRAHDVRDPLRTITSAKGGEFALASPHITKFRNGAVGHAVDDPLATVTANSFEKRAGGAVPLGLVTGYLAPRYGERAGQEPRAIDITEPHPTVVPTGNGGSLVAASLQQLNTRDVGQDVADPLRTIAGHDHQAMLAASIVGCGGRRGQSPPVEATEPLPTVTGKADACLSGAYLVRSNFQSAAARNGIRDVEEPMASVTGDGGIAMSSAYLVRQFGSSAGGSDIEDPVPTIMPCGGEKGGGGKDQLITAHLGSYYGVHQASDGSEPMHTATGKDRHALTMAWLEQANTRMVGHEATDPLSTIVAGAGPDCGWGAATQRLIEARLELDGGPIGRRAAVLDFLWTHFGVPTAGEWADPTGTLEARRKFGLVLLPGRSTVAPGGAPDPLATEIWMVVDIGLRMLLARELARATGLSDAHDLSVDCHGRRVSKTHQTQMIGNMVTAEPATSLIRTQCPDMCPIEPDRRAA